WGCCTCGRSRPHSRPETPLLSSRGLPHVPCWLRPPAWACWAETARPAVASEEVKNIKCLSDSTRYSCAIWGMDGRDRRFMNRAIGVMADGTSVPFWNNGVPKGRDGKAVDWARRTGGGGTAGKYAARPHPRAQPCAPILV